MASSRPWRSFWVLTAAALVGALTSATVAHGEHLGPADKNCSNFQTWQEANGFFLNAGPGDPHHLDSNHDGVPCESLPGAPGGASSAPSNTPRPAATRRPTATPVPTATPTAAPTEAPTPTRPAARPSTTGSPMAAAPAVTSPTVRSPGASPGSANERVLSPDPGVQDSPVSTELDPEAPRIPDAAGAPADGTRNLPPPAERWLLVVSTAEVVGEAGDFVRLAEPGQWMAVVETRDGWVRVVAGEDGPLVRWIRLDERVQIVVRERGTSAP